MYYITLCSLPKNRAGHFKPKSNLFYIDAEQTRYITCTKYNTDFYFSKVEKVLFESESYSEANRIFSQFRYEYEDESYYAVRPEKVQLNETALMISHKIPKGYKAIKKFNDESEAYDWYYSMFY